MEADYNLVLKTIWGRRLINRAQEHNLLHNGQHARPRNLVSIVSLNKKISYNLIQQMKQLATSFDNGAKGCYNFIIPPHAMIACQRLGLPKKSAEMITIVLKNTAYLIKTGHGPGARKYQTTALYRILGVGQGTGSAPCIWTTILDTILWSVSMKYASFIITSPTNTVIKRLGDAFVDDTSLMTTNSPTKTQKKQ